MKQKRLCVVCRTPIPVSGKQPDQQQQEKLVEKIDALRNKLASLESEIDAFGDAIAKSQEIIQGLQTKVSKWKRDIQQQQYNLLENKSELSKLLGTEFGGVVPDTWLDEQQKQIARLDVRINNLYRQRDEASKSLKELNEQIISLLNNVNSELTPLFSEYASKFLGTRCKLVVSQRRINKKPVAYMYPSFNEKDRSEMEQVSESQRFFLDQAFRMALITWFTQHCDQPTFYIIETPEGSLDLAYEMNVAEMYVEFSKQEHVIIVTSNLNTSNFLSGLYGALGNAEARQLRTLDLLQIGRLSQIQIKSLPDFNKRLQMLGLPEVSKP